MGIREDLGVTPIELVQAKEEEIKFNLFESAFAVDEAGNAVMDRAGELFRIDFTQEEVERLRAERGVIFTHNHPRGWEYPVSNPLRAGSSFSEADVAFACGAEVAEMRVVTPTRRFFLRPADDGWSRAYWNDALRPVFARHEAEVQREFRLRVRQRQMSWEEAGAEDMHEIWSRVATEVGLTYGREQE
jgi:hypothetical protein